MNWLGPNLFAIPSPISAPNPASPRDYCNNVGIRALSLKLDGAVALEQTLRILPSALFFPIAGGSYYQPIGTETIGLTTRWIIRESPTDIGASSTPGTQNPRWRGRDVWKTKP